MSHYTGKLQALWQRQLAARMQLSSAASPSPNRELCRWLQRSIVLLLVGLCSLMGVPTSQGVDAPPATPTHDIPTAPRFSLPPSVRHLRLPWQYVGSLAFGPDDTIYLETRPEWPPEVDALTPDANIRWKSHEINQVVAFGRKGTVCGTSQDGNLCALDATGNVKWRWNLPDKDTRNLWAAAAPDGTVYLAGWGSLRAIDSLGNLKWKYDGIDRDNIRAALSPDGAIYVVNGYRRSVEAFAPNGTHKWSYSPLLNRRGGLIALATAPDGTLYVTVSDGYVHALRPDGTVKWKFPAGEFWGAPAGTPLAVAPDGTIYVNVNNSGQGRLFAISPDGLLKWVYDKVGQSTPAVGADGTVYIFGTSYPSFCALTPEGAVKWRAALEDDVDASPAVNARGTVYVIPHTDNSLYIIQPGKTDPNVPK